MTRQIVQLFPEAWEDERERKEKFEEMTRLVSSWYVRKDNKFFDINRMGVKLSRDDVERASLRRLADGFEGGVDAELLKQAFAPKHRCASSLRQPPVHQPRRDAWRQQQEDDY